MRRNSQYVISGLGALAALGFFVVGLEMSAATASSGLHRTATQTQSVERASKGDRLPLISEKARSRNAVNGPVEMQAPRAPVRQELLDGCESIVSAIAQSPLSQVPGRCVS
jgi:hypothetical protein